MDDLTISIARNHHLAAMLPESAREKLAAMKEAKDDQYAVLRLAMDRQRQAADLHNEAEKEFRRLDRAMQDGLLVKETPLDRGGVRREYDADRLEAAKANLAKIDEERAKLAAQYEARAATWRAHAAVVDRIEKYLKTLPQGTELTVVKPTAAKVPRTASLLAEIDRVRAAIRKLKADARDVLMAPITSGEAKAYVAAWVAAQGAKGRPNLYGLIDGAFRIEFPTSNFSVMSAVLPVDAAARVTPAHGTGSAVDPVAFQAWFNPDAMIAALNRDIDAISDDASALDKATRAIREVELSKQLLEAEREEEALVEAALAERLAVLRRADADPRAVLNLSSDLPGFGD